jgi:hypothetical protein
MIFRNECKEIQLFYKSLKDLNAFQQQFLGKFIHI